MITDCVFGSYTWKIMPVHMLMFTVKQSQFQAPQYYYYNYYYYYYYY